LKHQQNLAYAEVGVIVLVASSNRIETLKPLMQQVNEVLYNIKVGELMEIEVGS